MSVAQPIHSISSVTKQMILDRAADIANEISTSDEATMYWQARQKMERHQEAQRLFDALKKKTNSLLVLKDRLGEDNDKYRRIEDETRAIEQQLSEIPVAFQYKSSHTELNNMLQEVMLVLLNRLNGGLPVEAGPRQCGSGGSCSTGGCGGSCSSH